MHLVLLGDATAHEMHVTGAVPLHLQRARLERPLLSDEDVEVVVGGVEARVTLRTERRAKDDEVLRDARVDHVHRAHRAARVVEDPFGAVRVERDARARIGRGEIGDDVRDHPRCVVGRRGERGQLELVQMDRIKDVPSILRSEGCRFSADARETKETFFFFFLGKRECFTLIVSSQLKVASVMNRKMALAAHLVSGSHFWDSFGSGEFGVTDPDFFPDIFWKLRWRVSEDGERARTGGVSLWSPQLAVVRLCYCEARHWRVASR